jgi:uncharacterized protein (TIGR03083 family)
MVTRLPGWRLPELVIHLVASINAVSLRLATAAPSDVEIDLPSYVLSVPAVADVIAQRERGTATGFDHAALKRELRSSVARLTRDLECTEPDRIVATRFGAMRFDEFVATRCVEGVIHGLDLVAALPGLALQADPQALKITVRALLGALVARAPGKSVEVRVPPIAAVQCVEGPRHTRGTPANVVEADPITWIEVAAGRLSWQDATADGRLRASGERSDISGLLPLL